MSAEIIPIPVADPLVTAWLDTSDLGNGKRVAAIAAGKLLWVEDAQAWVHYDGRRWSIERGAIEAQRVAHRVVEHIDREAVALGELAENAIALQERVGPWCTPEIAQERVKTLRGACGEVGQRLDDIRHAAAGAVVAGGNAGRVRRRSAGLQHAERHAALRRDAQGGGAWWPRRTMRRTG